MKSVFQQTFEHDDKWDILYQPTSQRKTGHRLLLHSQQSDSRIPLL